MNAQYYDFENSIGFLTFSANRLLNAYFRKRLLEEGLDLTPEQWGVLAALWNAGSIAQDELATLLCVDKSSLSRVLDVMERRGLVRRERVVGEARRKSLFPTPGAEALRGPCAVAASKVMTEVLGGFDQEELVICLKVLKRMKRSIRELSE
jgi:DNA-binding MarR family transcriptional regulator